MAPVESPPRFRIANHGRMRQRTIRRTSYGGERLDIDDMMQWGGIRAFARLAGGMRFNFYGDQIEVNSNPAWASRGRAGCAWNMRWRITGLARKSRLTTRFFSQRRDHHSVGCDGGSCARN
jgi:hypothetical protein